VTVKQLDIINIGLMLLACVAAFLIPFELFLLSYAILGPLHYLTEIGWLHKRDYFSTGKFDYLWLSFLCLVVVMLGFVFTDVDPKVSAYFMFVGFTSAVAMIAFPSFFHKVIAIIVIFFLGLLFIDMPLFLILFAILLPTIIHVFLFTAFFIIQGALKNKSITGLFSVLVFIACAVSFFIYQPRFDFYTISTYARENLVSTTFHFVNQYLLYFGGVANPDMDAIFNSTSGYSVMRLIAFAYTYHYLNWFSKTSVIKWHEVSKKWLATVVIVWLASVGLYFYDYMVGLKALLLLSMLHVFLEFPLNFRSLQGIFGSVKELALHSKNKT
jgi:hypothetical protein